MRAGAAGIYGVAGGALTLLVVARTLVLTLCTLAAARALPLEVATFIGQLAGGQAVQVPGNAEPVSKAKLLKSGMSLLNF